MMIFNRSFLVSVACILVSVLGAQSIPHANFTGPLGLQVNTYNGNLFTGRTDLYIPNQDVPLDFSSAYNSFKAGEDDGLGAGWEYNHGMRCVPYLEGVVVQRPDGRLDSFARVGNQYVAPIGIFDELTAPVPGEFALTTKLGMVYYFDDPSHYYVTKVENTNGVDLSFTYVDTLLTQIKDDAGRRINMSWLDGHLVNVNDNNFPGGRSWTYTYDVQGRLECVQNPMGDCVSYGYDQQDRLSLMMDERGEEVRVTYNREGRVAAIISCIAETTFTYSESPRRTIVTERNDGTDHSTIFTYSNDGQLLNQTGNCCGFDLGYTYDPNNNISAIEDANGNTFQTIYDAEGNPIQNQDPLGQVNTMTYADLNRMTSFSDKNGNTTNFTYDEAGNPMEIVSSLGTTLSMTYDEQGNLASTTDGRNFETTMAYNGNNDLTTISYPIGQESYLYDAAGNLASITDPNNNTKTLVYDALNRPTAITDARNFTTYYGYDAASNLTTEVSAEGDTINYNYDAHNQLVGVSSPAGVTTYEYDRTGNLTLIMDGNLNSMQFGYDSRNRMEVETDGKGFSTRYVYDNNGNVTQRIDANMQVTQYTYDALNRLTQKQYSGNTENFSYDANDNLIQCSNDQISYRFTYDALNRMTSRTIENWGITISYEYDLVGNRTKMIDAEGGETRYTYDANNRLIVLRNPASEITFFTYDAGGRLIEQRNHNGSYTAYTYNTTDHITSLINYDDGGSILSSYTYTYDGDGLRTSMTDNTGGTATYQYDDSRRLIGVTYTNGSQETFVLDPAGNRLQSTKDGQSIAYSHDAANRMTAAGDIFYDFDGNGNLISKNDGGQITTYAYDGENRLTRVTSPDGAILRYAYDPFGNRISRRSETDETVRYVMDGDNILYEIDQDNGPIARYTALEGMDAWISMERAGTSYVYHTDGLGSITALTNDNAQVVATYAYDAYGQITEQTGSVTNPFTYTGREWDADVGLYYYRSRYYDASVGRFTSKDQFAGVLSQPQSQNLYAYVYNDPINFIDPVGESPLSLLGGLLGAGIELFIAYQRHDGNWKCILNDSKTWTNIIEGALIGAVLPGGSLSKAYRYKQQANQIRKSAPRLAKRWERQEEIRRKVPALRNRHSSYEEWIGRANRLDQEARGKFVGGAKNALSYGKNAYDLAEIYVNGPSECSQSPGAQEPEPPRAEEPPVGPPSDDNCIIIPIIRSMDPNEIIGPTGVGQQQWVKQDETLPYTILFENDPEFATAAAQRVIIRHAFDETVAPFSFRLGDFGFADYYFTVPEDISYYNQRLDLRDSLGLFLDVIAGIDANTNEAFWVFESIDPATGLATTLPAEAGFLAINDTITRVGEGFVNFTVEPKLSAVTGDEIEAQALIIFDDNASIETNIHVNTIDGDHPITGVTAIDTLTGSYALNWEASDVGSGLQTVNLYQSINGQGFQPIASFGPSETSHEVDFNDADDFYRFFTIGIDSVGNREPLKLVGEPDCMSIEVAEITPAEAGQSNGTVEISVTGNNGTLTYSWSHDPTLDGAQAAGLAAGTYEVYVTDVAGCTVAATITIDMINSVPTVGAQAFILQLYPVPASNYLDVVFAISEPLCHVQVVDLSGKILYQEFVRPQGQQQEQLRLDISYLPAGSYVLRISGRESAVASLFQKVN